MKCRQCGAEISDGAKFCEMCGARVEAEVNETPVATEEAVTGAVEETVKPEAPAETSFAAEKPAFSPIPSEPVKKKMPVWGKVVAGLIGVVAIIAVLACCSKVVGNTLRKWFLSPEKYLAYVLKDNFGESINDGLTVYDEYIKNSQTFDNIESNIKFEIALGDELSDYIKEYAGYYSSEAEWITWVKKASIEYGINSYKGDSEFKGKIGANGVDLVSLSLYANPDGTIYFAVPELCTKTVSVKVDPEALEEVLNVKDKMNSILKELPNKPELKKISRKYLKAIFDNVNGVERTNEVITVEDISAKATVLSMEIDDVLLTNIEADILEAFLEDKEFEKIWMRMYDAYEEVISDTDGALPDKAESYEEIKKNAQKALDEAKEKLALYKDDQLENNVQATIKFYVDYKGAISGCDITGNEFNGYFFQPSKGGRFGIDMSVASLAGAGEYDSFTLVGTGKESASVITANMTASVNGEKLFDVVINNMDKSVNKKGEGSFDVAITNINFGETSESDLEVLNDIIGDTNIGFYYKGTVSKKGADATMSLGNGEKDLFSLSMKSEVKNGSAVKVDDADNTIVLDMESGDGLGDILNAVDEKTFADKLRQAGANEDLVTSVESVISSLKSLAAYY